MLVSGIFSYAAEQFIGKRGQVAGPHRETQITWAQHLEQVVSQIDP